MDYVPPLRLLRLLGEVRRAETSVTLPTDAFHALLRAAFSGSTFDAEWYQATYPDVAEAVAGGDVPDALTHFVRFGYFENRKPRAFDVDSQWYEETYRDVATAIDVGLIADAHAHFNTSGYFEPRAPDAKAAAAYADLLQLAAGQMTVPERPGALNVVAARRIRRA